MKNYIIINPTSKFGHDFVQRDENGNEMFRKEITSKTTDGYYRLPIIVNGHKLCKISHIGDATEFCIDTLPEKSARKTVTAGATKNAKIDYSEHYTKEEAEKVKKHQDAIDKINAEVKVRVEREMTEKALLESAMSLSIEQLQALINAKTEAKA